MEGSNSPREMLLLNGHAEGAAHLLGLTNSGASCSNSLPAGNVKTDHFNGDDISSCSFMSIPQFYAGRSVFITGGTGFMGKVSSCFETKNKKQKHVVCICESLGLNMKACVEM